MVDAVQGRDTSVRDTISKGGFVQGAQHPRIFGRGHIGWGHINPASRRLGVGRGGHSTVRGRQTTRCWQGQPQQEWRGRHIKLDIGRGNLSRVEGEADDKVLAGTTVRQRTRY